MAKCRETAISNVVWYLLGTSCRAIEVEGQLDVYFVTDTMELYSSYLADLDVLC
jgi:hypothetical protein